MIDITTHAVERYIERVMKIETREDEMKDLVKKLGGQIHKTLNSMVKNSDLTIKSYGTRDNISETFFVLYRGLAIVINNNYNGTNKTSGLKISTIFEIKNPFLDESEYYEYINFIKDKVGRLKEKFYELNFTGDNDGIRAVKGRIEQYKDLLFHNPTMIHKSNKEEEV